MKTKNREIISYEEKQSAGLWSIILLCVLLFGDVSSLKAQDAGPCEPFAIRGTLPWHNFLSGPTAWNEADYREYLDRMKAMELNLIVFHCYTGGHERYVTYVEPLIKIRYRDVTPLAALDTTLTARWGYRPMKVKDFPYGTDQLFKLPDGAEAFGADCALLARDNDDRYRRCQELMRKVMDMAHERGIKFAIGFEVGVHPPEFASIAPGGTHLWGTIGDPTKPASQEILRATIDDIFKVYPGIDYIWLWIHEHSATMSSAAGGLAKLSEKNSHYFEGDQAVKTSGVFSLEYINQAYRYIKEKNSNVNVVISGWLWNKNLPGVLKGLDKALPKDIIFSALSPDQGWSPQPDFFTDIARNRQIWAIPWLEGDRKLLHLQPRVNLMREHVKLARRQKLDGVIGIHWRTEETRLALEVFARFAKNPSDTTTVEAIYRRDCASQYGPEAAKTLTPVLTELDIRQGIDKTISPDYFPYSPSWGRLNEKDRRVTEDLLVQIRGLARTADSSAHQQNLNWLADKLQYSLLFDEVSQAVEPAYKLKDQYLLGQLTKDGQAEAVRVAKAALDTAPVQAMLTTYARTVRSRGEMGVLCSLNQRVYLQFRELQDFLKGLNDSHPN